jgi:type I restriction enzyme S subunit
MSELPKGWISAKISDVTADVPSIKPEATPSKEFHYVDIGSLDNKTNRIVETKTFLGMDAPSRARRPVQKQDVLFSNVRTYLKNIAFVDGTIPAEVCSTGFTVLRTNEACLPRYLFHWVKSEKFIRSVSETQTGTHYPATSDRQVRAESVPLAPLNEQKRIVAKLDELLPKVEACKQRLEKIPTILKRFRQSVLADAVSGKLTESWRNGKSLEEAGWQVKCIEDVCKVRTGATPLRANQDYWLNGTVPWIKTGEVQNCEILTAEERITEKAISETNAKVFPAGTILIAMYGEGKTRGQVGIMRIAAATNQACAALMLEQDDEVLRQYVYLFCQSQYQKLREQSFGGNQPNLSLGTIKQWEIALPGRDEMKEILRQSNLLLGELERLNARVITASGQVSRVSDAVLSKAFSGLLVDQNPSDEPATTLLERIRSSASTPKQKKAPSGKRKAAK